MDIPTTPLGQSFAALPDQFFSPVTPTPVHAPAWISFNQPLAQTLGMDLDVWQSEDGLAILAGNKVAPNSQPVAMAYAGHQFGNWVPQLGDGRAHILGDVTRADGKVFDLQLKGSGPTPFSRNGDGRAALGPVLREYVMSEAMHALGVPTTRALAAISTGERVQRETGLPGAVLTRVASSFVRVGTFQYFMARGQHDALAQLADFVIERHHPELKEADHKFVKLLEAIIARQAELIAHWQLIGFIHGVMNTDNMAVSGETIDYGPCAFVDHYHPETVFSSIDEFGRYAYHNQPRIARWNLGVLAQCFLPILHQNEDAAVQLAQDAINEFAPLYDQAFQAGLCRKIGLRFTEENMALAVAFLDLLQKHNLDFTNSFRSLVALDPAEIEVNANQFEGEGWRDWLGKWAAAHDNGDASLAERKEMMRTSNPRFIPRNHLMERMIEEAMAGDLRLFNDLNRVYQRPFDDQSDFDAFTAPPTNEERVLRTFCGT
jgi:uncharacterized protein YdiU (UPF0061 family)